MALYDIVLVLVGIAVLGTVALPRLLDNRPISFPIVYVAFGAVVFALPLGLPAADPLEFGTVAERSTELGVIVALMGAGLKIDRPPGLTRWQSTWRLLGITMPVTIGAAVVLGWGVVGLTVPAAMLLGAVIAPTDPVLAADVQVDPPRKGESDEIRFALTSEAGLNDGLAFPFTYLAIAMATAGVAPSNWLLEWVTIDVIYKIGVGVLLGWILGRVLARFVFQFPASTRLAKAMGGAEALAATLIAYGLTELANGYGFIAVFVAAIEIRGYEREHEYHQELHDFAEVTERLVMAVLLVLFGGAIATGLFDALTWQGALVGLALVLLVRPLAGLLGLVGYPPERNAIAFFGIRGIGSFYYLSYALNQASFAGAETVWATVGFAVLVSIVVHGVTAAPVMADLRREITTPEATN